MIGIPTFNGSHRVDNLLKSIFKWNDQPTGYTTDILLVDDASHAEKHEEMLWIAMHYNIPVIPHKENFGITKSWNDMAGFGGADIIVLLNDDILVSQNWLTVMVYFLERNPGCGTVGWDQDFITYGDTQSVINSDNPIRIYRDPSSKKLFSFPRYPESDRPGRHMAPTGSAFAFTRESYELVGGFDERFKSFYEEMDFSTKLVEQGKPGYMLHFPRLYHMFSQTFSENDDFLRGSEELARSRQKYIKKWGGDLDYTDKKFMPKIEPVRVQWLDNNLDEQEGVLS